MIKVPIARKTSLKAKKQPPQSLFKRFPTDFLIIHHSKKRPGRWSKSARILMIETPKSTKKCCFLGVYTKPFFINV